MPKTATIKLRLSDDEKANWEAQADADGVTLSSLIRHRMNHPTTRADGVLEEQWAERNRQIDGTALINNAISLLRPQCSGPAKAACTFPECNGGTTCSPRSGPQDFPPTTGPGVVATDSPRRSTQCEHGRPQYVFCPTCDA